MRFNIIHKYLFKELLRMTVLSLLSLILLFLIFDFFDRIDNVLSKDPDFLTIMKYFLYKIPKFTVLTLPIAITTGTLFTYGLLSKNSEITAMRASGLTLIYLSIPLLILAFALSLFNLFLTETVVPRSVRAVKEIYDIDIQEKDKAGTFSQSDIWWRDDNKFYSVNIFDSRNSNLHGVSLFEVDRKFEIKQRLDSNVVKWVNPTLGWEMNDVSEYTFSKSSSPQYNGLKSLPLPIKETPEDFYRVQKDPLSMTYSELHSFIDKQNEYGKGVKGLLSDLYAKISFPFVVFICAFSVLPFAIKPARTGSLALSFISGILICFSYYTVHSFSIALGMAELIPPMIAAWSANIILGVIGGILFLGVESPE